ncbi:hypothetical protein MKW98_017827, partial [Papaver atlanticum]
RKELDIFNAIKFGAGQPRCHLLTTGWSIFVLQKNLVWGDAILFLRGENGELRLGIRRAGRPRNITHYSILADHIMNLNDLSPVANAVSTKSMFRVFHGPRLRRIISSKDLLSFLSYISTLKVYHKPGSTIRLHIWKILFRHRFDTSMCVMTKTHVAVQTLSDVNPDIIIGVSE